MRSAFAILVLAAATCGCAQKEPRVADSTAGVSSSCPVHHVQMEKREVTVALGVPGPVREAAEMAKLAGSIEAFQNDERTLFPFWRTGYFGGDEIDERTPKKAVIYVCPECIKAFSAWRAKKDGY